MTTSTSSPRAVTEPGSDRYAFTDLLPAGYLDRALRDDVVAGLTAPAKRTSPTWLYDKVGSDVFEEITRLPEYYPTRCEREILTRRASDAVRLSGCTTLVELGSGSSLKTGLLLSALARAVPGPGARPGYLAVDVSEDALREACARIEAGYPGLDVHAVRADFTTQLDTAMRVLPPDRGTRMVAFLGGTIGNFEPGPRAEFLAGLRHGLTTADHLLLGADLVKSPTVLVPAYDDAAGVTAAFDLNLLQVLNRAFDGDFDVERFRHRAVWDARQEWIEMRLRSDVDQVVTLRRLGLRIPFAAGEEIRTEVSAKFRRERLTAELAEAGFRLRRWWMDPNGWFSLSLWRAI